MKFIILRNNLIEALSSIEKSVGNNPNLPILKSIFIKTEENRIVFISTDLAMAITHISSGKVIEKGETTVSFSILNSIIKNINSERITIEVKSKKLTIATDNYEGVLQTQESKEFPIIPLMHNRKEYLKTSTKTFLELLQSVIPATQYSEIRPEINGVFFNIEGKNITLVATDSFRLAERIVEGSKIESSIQEARFIIPIKTAEEIAKIFSSRQEEELEIFIDHTQISFETEAVKVISRLIDGNFPDYKAIIPNQSKTEIITQREELIQGIKLVSSFSGKTNDITLSVGDSKKHLECFSSDSSLGESSYKVPIKLNGEKIKLVFNWRYLLDGVKLFKSEDIILSIIAQDRPVVLKSEKEKGLIYVVMPIRG